MITQSLVNAGVVLGITIVTQKGYLLYFIRQFLEGFVEREMLKEYSNQVSHADKYLFVFKPLLLCPVCMNSFWGIIICLLSAYVHEINIDMRFVISSVFSILISSFICYAANKYILNH